MLILRLLQRRSMPAISRRLCTGAVITIIAAGIIIVGTAIMAGTTVIMDGGIITITAVTGIDPLLHLSHRQPITSRCHDVVASASLA